MKWYDSKMCWINVEDVEGVTFGALVDAIARGPMYGGEERLVELEFPGSFVVTADQKALVEGMGEMSADEDPWYMFGTAGRWPTVEQARAAIMENVGIRAVR